MMLSMECFKDFNNYFIQSHCYAVCALLQFIPGNDSLIEQCMYN